MLKKLLAGEMSLVNTFWKFGVLGLPVVTIIVKILGRMLTRKFDIIRSAYKLPRLSILDYLISPKYSVEFSTTILILMYLSAASFLLFYCYSLLFGAWRSSAEYDRSLWFRHLSRIFMALMVFVALKLTFEF